MLAALVIGLQPLGAQAIHPRWELTIRGTDTIEAGDLRFDGSSGRVLLQHADSAFQPLLELQIGGGRISFSLARGHRRFEGTVTAAQLSGTVRDAAGNTSTWEADPLGPDSDRWPVPPRVVVRQLAMGSTATTERVPIAWLAPAPDLETLEREYRDLAGRAMISPLTGADRSSRANLASLGLEESGRSVVRTILGRIMQGSAADPAFRTIFMRDGRWKVDIHDAVLWEATHYVSGFRLLGARETGTGRRIPGVAEALGALGELVPGTIDSATVRQGGWRFWSRASSDSALTFSRIDTLARHDEESANQLRALLAGFNDAAAWWRRAVSWLLTHAWLDTPAGPRSPAQLMAAFWGVDSLPLPEILDTRLGGVAAMPAVSVEHIARWLFQPANGSAAEWLPRGGALEAFSVWRPLRWGESPLTVVIGGRSETVASPGSQALVHPASFFAPHDAIRIDPGIMPLAAVAVFLHEWNHLLAAERRLEGVHPAALVTGGAQLQVREEDPWLAEGFAEWATDEVLRPAGGSAGYLRFTQAEKRLGIASADPNNPHFLGYRIVRGAARTHPATALRDMLVRNLHDAGAFARAAGLSPIGPGRSIILQRLPTAIVIPEVSFTWDEGTVFNFSRRLVIPNSHPEH